MNLLLNSASALTESARQTPEIVVSATLQGTDVVVVVADNGRGIAPDDIKRLTDPFYSTSDTPDNLGLGLSICQTIMRHHNGSMTIASDPGERTRVTLTLPQQPAPGPAAAAVS